MGKRPEPFHLKNKATGRCLHTASRSATNGAKVVFWDGCSGEKNKFQRVNTGDGDRSFYLKNKATGRCLHTASQSATNGAKVVFWDGCSGEKNKFVFSLIRAVAAAKGRVKKERANKEREGEKRSKNRTGNHQERVLK